MWLFHMILKCITKYIQLSTFHGQFAEKYTIDTSGEPWVVFCAFRFTPVRTIVK